LLSCVPRPSRSTLFPYTTLFRSVDVDDDKFRAQLAQRAEVADGVPQDCDLIFLAAPERAALAKLAPLRHHLKPDGALWVLRPKRSEEHTSELQSPDHLVCRLLLE